MSDFSMEDPFPDEKINKDKLEIERYERNLLLIVDDISSWIYKVILFDLMWAYYALKLNKEEETKKLFLNENEKVFQYIYASNMKNPWYFCFSTI